MRRHKFSAEPYVCRWKWKWTANLWRSPFIIINHRANRKTSNHDGSPNAVLFTIGLVTYLCGENNENRLSIDTLLDWKLLSRNKSIKSIIFFCWRKNSLSINSFIRKPYEDLSVLFTFDRIESIMMRLSKYWWSISQQGPLNDSMFGIVLFLWVIRTVLNQLKTKTEESQTFFKLTCIFMSSENW